MKLQRKRNKVVWLVAGAIVLAVAIVGAVFFFTHQTKAPERAVQVVVPPAAKPVSVQANTLFFGNVFWGRYINDWSMASPLKTAYPFSRLNEFDRNKYDAWIAGLECPTVAGFTQTSAEEDSTLSFNCSPDYLPEAAKWFTAFTLANNHTDNRGTDGFAETRQQLDKNGIQYFGHYDPDVVDEVCDVISLPVTVTYDDKTTKKEALPVAFCGYHGVFKIPSEESLAEIERHSKIMPVIAMPHMGVEYKAAPDQLKTQTYRAMIDHGADMVLADHPHWIQNTEAYKGKLIVYSMGNFIFDQQDTAEVTRSAAINVLMTSANTPSDQLTGWLKVGEACKGFHDQCLQTALDEGLQKLPFEYAYGAIGTNDGQKIVKPANEAQQASILQRLNWQNTMTQLLPPNKSL